MVGTVLIFSGGDRLTPDQVGALPTGATVIGADSGVDRAHDAGFTVDVAIGDFDSVTADGLLRAEQAGAEVRRFPAAKDQTDLELALGAALELEPERIVLAAMGGGRPDHELAGLMLLADQRLAGTDVDVVLEGARMSVVFDRRTFTGRVGDVLSLIPIGGDANGVTTKGLEYPLDDETLQVTKGRGISNVFAAPVSVVSLTGGVLFAYQPDREQ